MLSYRHAFHAGNHADMLKHFCLFAVLRYYNHKDKPYWYIDTHAGAGLYDLRSEQAQKVGEYRDGLARLLAAEHLPAELADFCRFIRHTLPDTATNYCGSPWLAQALMREQDRLRLFELHPADAAILLRNMRTIAHPHRAQVFDSDGFKGLLSMLPPPCRRAVVLIDPPYEQKHDYRQVVDTLKAAVKKFATGCYLVWYPCLNREDSRSLPEALQKNFGEHYLRVELHVCAPHADGFGMAGSGMFVVNPPYTLADTLNRNLPALVSTLAQDPDAHFVLQHHIP